MIIKKWKLSLGQKMALATTIVSIMLVFVALLFSYLNYANRTYNQYKTLASNLAKTTATQLEPDKISTYLKTMEKDEAYEKMLQSLFNIKNNNNIQFLYVIKIHENTRC